MKSSFLFPFLLGCLCCIGCHYHNNSNQINGSQRYTRLGRSDSSLRGRLEEEKDSFHYSAKVEQDKPEIVINCHRYNLDSIGRDTTYLLQIESVYGKEEHVVYDAMEHITLEGGDSIRVYSWKNDKVCIYYKKGEKEGVFVQVSRGALIKEYLIPIVLLRACLVVDQNDPFDECTCRIAKLLKLNDDLILVDYSQIEEGTLTGYRCLIIISESGIDIINNSSSLSKGH